MHSIVVSCKSGYHIKDLRDKIFDIASQVKESIGMYLNKAIRSELMYLIAHAHYMVVGGHGVGCGRIPDHRPLMDQLIPAFYFQLEKIVQNITMSMRSQGKHPVITYKELRYMYDIKQILWTKLGSYRYIIL